MVNFFSPSNEKQHKISFFWRYRVQFVLGLFLLLVLVHFIFRVGNDDDMLAVKSESIFVRNWLQHQKRNLVQKSHSKHESVVLTSNFNESSIANFDAFSTLSKVFVWDLYPPQSSCPDLIRLGYIGDGGKWICGTSWLREQRHKRECLIYSFGINTDSTFELELGALSGCSIHAFDPTIGVMPYVTIDQVQSSGNVNEILKKDKFVANDDIVKTVTFHKTAMGVRSGRWAEHSLAENLYDIMHRLNHTFIDILKVDIEGSEWKVFSSLLGNLKGFFGTIPVGQILVELHFESMTTTDSFFTAMADAGFVSISREINLQPCVEGRKPVAVEYSFINPDTFFSPKNELPFQKPPPPVTAGWNTEIPAVIYFLTQRGRVLRMQQALRLLFKNFWHDFPYYPVVIFHDDLDAKDKIELQKAVPNMKLTFIFLKFEIPSNLDPKSVPQRTVCAPKSSTVGYRHMCRFHGYGVHNALKKNGFHNIEFIFRLDDDSLLTAPVGYDLFRFMKANNKLYGFVSTLQDDALCIEGLWNLARQVVNRTTYLNRTKGFFDQWPDGLVIYNNFEISHTSLWQEPFWLEFVKVVEDSGGIYFKRWGDAPLRKT